jgi:hypothetical protein
MANAQKQQARAALQDLLSRPADQRRQAAEKALTLADGQEREVADLLRELAAALDGQSVGPATEPNRRPATLAEVDHPLMRQAIRGLIAMAEAIAASDAKAKDD